MPSIPQSLLWISLVVLWLFVLVPMLINKRDAVRRTSDVALATRVLNSAGSARLIKRSGPAAGHRGDPNWTPRDEDDDLDDVDDYDDDEVAADAKPRLTGVSVMVMSAVTVNTSAESDYLDVDIVEENSGALPAAVEEPQTDVIDIASEADEPTFDDVLAEDAPAEPEFDGDDARAVDEDVVEEPVGETVDDVEEDVDDQSVDSDEAPRPKVTHVADRDKRRSNQMAAAAKVAARKYKFRKRMVTALVLAVIGLAVASCIVMSALWWACGVVGAITVLYLIYLRRQTAIEERLRRRRQQRMARAKLGVENTSDAEFEVTPSRLRRPGAVVLEIDDEDPEFEHLEYVPFARHYDLPKASGQ